MMHRMKAALIGVVAAGALAAPADAAVTTPGASIEVFHGRDFIGLAGYPAGDDLLVEVVRNGTVIANVTRAPDPGEEQGDPSLLEINHLGDGDCFDNPAGQAVNLVPGDVIRVTELDVAGDVPDTMLVQQVTQERVDDAVAGTITLSGDAKNVETGAPLPGTVALRVRNGGTRQDFEAPIDANGRYSHTFAVANPGAFDSSAEWANADLSELTIEDGAEIACPLAPEANMSNISPPFINIANSAGNVTVSGQSTADVTDVTLTLNGAALEPASKTVGAATWTATFPASALAEGVNTIEATFVGGNFPASSISISKDTVAPAAPTISPNGGTVPQSITISGTGTIHYTVDGSTPTADSPVTAAQLNITSPTTVRAVAIDNSGNVSPVASATFTAPVNNPPAGGNNPPAGGPPAGGNNPPAGPPAGGGPVVVTPDAPGNPVNDGPFIVSNVKYAKRIKVRKARRVGLRVALTAPAETDTLRVVVRRAGKFRRTMLVKTDPGRKVFRVKVNRRGRWSLSIRPVDEGRRGFVKVLRFRVV